MKDPKALFPFLFASSWLGNLLLTLLAFYLAFTHDGPLSPLLFTTIALCILSGNILPILVYMITVKIRRIELEAEATEVTWRVQEGLKRSEDILNRLDEAEGALAKSILVARQVPERIRETMKGVHALADKINTLEINTFTESISNQTKAMDSVKVSLEDVRKAVSAAETDLGAVGKDVKRIAKSQTLVMDKLSETPKGRQQDDFEVSVAERLDLVYESLENVQDSLDGLLQRIAVLSKPTEELAEVEGDIDDVIQPEPEEVVKPTVSEADHKQADDGNAENEGDSIKEDTEFEDSPTEPSEEIIEDVVSEPDNEEEFQLTDGRTRIIAHAMIGMQNKLYIRGDQPWLSWEDGQQMELIGIGEFAWSTDNLKESIEVTVLINDEYAAEQGTVVLQPGKTVRVNPTFPKV